MWSLPLGSVRSGQRRRIVQPGAQVLVLVALVPVRAVVLAPVHHQEDVLEIGGAVGPFQRERGGGRAKGLVRPELACTVDLPRPLAFAALSPGAVRLKNEREVMECNWLLDDERLSKNRQETPFSESPFLLEVMFQDAPPFPSESDRWHFGKTRHKTIQRIGRGSPHPALSPRRTKGEGGRRPDEGSACNPLILFANW